MGCCLVIESRVRLSQDRACHLEPISASHRIGEASAIGQSQKIEVCFPRELRRAVPQRPRIVQQEAVFLLDFCLGEKPAHRRNVAQNSVFLTRHRTG